MVNRQRLHKDSIVKKHFTTAEIEDLTIILNAFDSLMVGTNKLNKSTFSKYQLQVASTLNRAIEQGSCCDFQVPSNLAVKMLDSISERTFIKLFKILRTAGNGKSRLYFWPRTIDKESEYRQLVAEINNPGIYQYLYNISAAGDVSLNLTHQFYPQIDLTDDKQRLLMAIDFISFTIQNHADINRIFQIAEQKSNLNEVQQTLK